MVLRHQSLSSIAFRTVALLIVVISSRAECAYLKKDIARLANSPIYYIQTPSLFNSRPMGGLNGGFSTANLFLTTLRKVQQQKRAQAAKAAAAAVAQTIVTRPTSASTVYRLPIQFLSNAKPIEVIAGTLLISLNRF